MKRQGGCSSSSVRGAMKKVEEVWRRFAAFSRDLASAKIGQQVLLTAASKALARGLNSGHPICVSV